MSDEQLELIQNLIEGAVAKAVPAAVEPAIKKYVNGKIDALTSKVDTHNIKHEEDMKDIKPFIQAKAGFSVLFKLFLMLGALAGAYLALQNVFRF